MGYLQAIVLGIVQGVTEFLPVSSDGHLAVTYRLFQQRPDLTFEVFLHLATLVAMIVYFRSDIAALLRSLGRGGEGSADRRLVRLIVSATGISAVLAMIMKSAVEFANGSLVLIGIGFLVTSAALVAGERLGRRASVREPDALGWRRTAAVAVAQALATLPGVSRSGMTISTGMAAGLGREAAARFSFLIGIPIIAAANVYEAKDVLTGAYPMPPAGVSLAGFAAAGVAGYAAMWLLFKLVRTRPLDGFAVYTSIAGLLTIAWGLLS